MQSKLEDDAVVEWDKSPAPEDVYLGKRLKERRLATTMTQETLGSALGLTFQQIQKYEGGTNRIPATRLYHISKLLRIPLDWFFEGLPTETSRHGFSDSVGKQQPLEDLPPSADSNILLSAETRKLINAYYSIKDDKQRRKVYELVKSMAAAAR